MTKVAFDAGKLKKELVAFVERRVSVTCQQASNPFCKTTRKNIEVYCLCQTTWIEGTTAKAIYGPRHKEFNAHSCCECGNWFHYHCLKACGVAVPKRTEDFLCPYCKKITVIPWGHPKYVNTCTLDNFLQIMYVMCLQINGLTQCFGASDSELALKASLMMICKGNVLAGKELMLEHLNSIIGYPRNGQTFDCSGSEHANCLTVFKNVWKIHLSLQCCSQHCPQCETDRFPCSFNLQPPKDGQSYLDQIQDQFPEANTLLNGYCGVQFKNQPPKQCQFDMTTELNVESGKESMKFVCKGQLRVKEARFVAKSPWLVPFSINSLNGQSLLMLPSTLTIFNKTYILGGFSLHRPGHFTAVVVWRGERYFYDGLHRQFLPLTDDHLDQHDAGSHAYYILDPSTTTSDYPQGCYFMFYLLY